MISFRILANLLTRKNFPKIILMGFFCLTATGCLNDNKIVGERQEIYVDPLARYLSNKGKNINLGKPRVISSITQVDNGPTHHFIHSSFNGLLSKAWETSVLKSGNLSAPIITEKNIFILDGKANMIAFDLSGNRVWFTGLAPKGEGRQISQYSGGLAIYKNKLFALTGYGDIVSLNPSKGSILWRRKFDSPFRGPPVINNKRLYSISSNDMAIAMNFEGDILWTLEGATRPTVIGKGVAPASSKNRIFFPFSAGVLKAVRFSNGAEVWSQSFDDANKGEAQSVIGDFGGSPIIKSGKIFMTSVSGQLLAINSSNGRIVWDAPVGSQSTPLIAGGSLFIVSSSGKLVRISEKKGKIIWSRSIGKKDKNQYKYFGPTLAGNYIWVTGTDGRLRKFDPVSGEQIVEYNFRNPALYRPFAAHNKLFVITRSGKLIAFN